MRLQFRWIGLVIVAFIVSSALYEQISRAHFNQRFSMPGQRYSVGPYQLHLYCVGNGSPTVVFESGLDSYGHMSWVRQIDALKEVTRVCSYDRAGIMFSERAGHATPLAMTIVNDLHALLDEAQERGPFLLVGHSLGGAYITLFANRYPSDVGAVLLLDAAHPQQLIQSGNDLSDSWWSRVIDDIVISIEPVLYELGLLRFYHLNAVTHEPEINWSESEQNRVDGLHTKSWRALYREGNAMPSTLSSLGQAHDLGSIPLLVVNVPFDPNTVTDEELDVEGITREQLNQIHNAQMNMHHDQSTWSSDSELVVIKGARHYVQFDESQQVNGLIRAMVNQYRLDKDEPK